MQKTPFWRVAPPPALAAEVRALALAEGRNDADMIRRLLAEAVEQRRRADSGVARLVRILKQQATEPAP
jgi:hypothetical protein